MRKFLLVSVAILVQVGCIRHYDDVIVAKDVPRQEAVADDVTGDAEVPPTDTSKDTPTGDIAPADMVDIKDGCIPNCGEETECGSDGCGGVCGTCSEGQECNDGECQLLQSDCNTCKDECGEDYSGPNCCWPGEKKCNGPKLIVCEDLFPDDLICDCWKWLDTLGEDCPNDYEVCKQLENGQFGCGCAFASCGDICCPEGVTCYIEGECCNTNCDVNECGPDGCGGSCGECIGQDLCVEGVCECQSACEDKECGDDSCGGSCGTCPAGESCGAGGQCQVVCGDGECASGDEDYCNCSEDCAASTCAGCCAGSACKVGTADNHCGENSASCQNCLVQDKICVNQQCQCQCDDGMCCAGETCYSCPGDCDSCCGNGACDYGETCETCPGDCGLCPQLCGDNTCNEDENCNTCPQDCGECPVECEPGVSSGTKTNGQYGVVWVEIPAGCFMMGCSPGDGGCGNDEKPPHEVTVSSFEMLETEVTEGQYLAFTGQDPSCDYGEGGGADSPVECVGWSDANAFCVGIGGRLPTEAEWEYAARGGTTTRYYCGDDAGCLDDVAWHGGNSNTHKHDVHTKLPNDYGLYDMLGNCWEWVEDWYSPSYYATSPAQDPPGPESGNYHVIRGGDWASSMPPANNDKYVRVTSRTPSSAIPGDRLGLRCVRTSGE